MESHERLFIEARFPLARLPAVCRHIRPKELFRVGFGSREGHATPSRCGHPDWGHLPHIPN